MSDLTKKKCQACSGFSEAVKGDDAKDFLKQIPGWEISADELSISRKFKFKNFEEVMYFVNAIAFVSYQEGHHPDVAFGYNYCMVSYTTHELKGLSENDFICAAKVNALLSV